MINDIVIKLFLFFLPSQLGLHFWPNQTRVAGLKIDYLSPTIYLTHILILCLLLNNLSYLLDALKKNKDNLLLLSVLFSLNTYFSSSPIVTVYKWLEIYLYLGLCVIIYTHKKTFIQNLKYLYLSTGIVFGLQIIQTIKQSSVQGVFYWLGERYFNYYTPSLPKLTIANLSLLRAPSTFSHANSLAGFMLLIFFLQAKLDKKNYFLKAITFASIILSFSKNAILSLFLLLLTKFKIRLLVEPFILFTLLSFFALIPKNLPYFITSRLEGYVYSLNVIRENFVFGTGLGAYIAGLSSLLPGSKIEYTTLQPVHNALLLITSEIGLIGLIIIYTLLKKNKLSTIQQTIVSIFLLTGLFDHYWLTQIQNKTLMIVSLCLFGVKYTHGKISKSSS